jgi:hypothetical protein
LPAADQFNELTMIFARDGGELDAAARQSLHVQSLGRAGCSGCIANENDIEIDLAESTRDVPQQRGGIHRGQHEADSSLQGDRDRRVSAVP